MRWVGSGEGEGEQGGWLCCFYLKNAESVGLESGSSVCQVVMKSLLPFLVESLGGRNDVKVSTAAAVNFTASESKRWSFFFCFFFPFGRGHLAPMTHRLLCVASRSRRRRD